MDIDHEILSRLSAIESLLQESAKKDLIISELHGDLTRRHTDILADLRRPVMQALLKVAARLLDIKRGAEKVVVLDNPEFENLRAQVAAASDFVEDILNEDFDVKLHLPEPGTPFLRERQQSIEIITTEQEDKDKTIAEVVEPGRESLASGKLLRQAVVKTYKSK